MTSKCTHEWSNSIAINSLGTLDDVLECEKCGLRKFTNPQERPEHLKHVPSKRFDTLVELFKPRI